MHLVLLNDDCLPAARGGSAVVAELERQELAKRGHQVTLVTSHQDGNDPVRTWRDESGEVISLLINYPLSQRHRRCLKMPAVSGALQKILSDLQPDAIHAHTIHTYLTYDALRVAAKVTDKVFMTAHDTFAVSFARIKSARYLADAKQGKLHHMKWTDHLAAVGRRYWPPRNAAIKKALRDSGTTVISISQVLDEFLHANGIKKTAIVPNGIQLTDPPGSKAIDDFRNRHSLTGPTILYGGRINADKGIGVMLKAMALVRQQIPNATLLVVGEAERLQPHLDACPDPIKDAVHCTGWIEQTQMPLAYGAANVVCTPSIYFDAFNMMNIEAMNAGKPVVGTCFGGTAEIVVDGTTGFVRNPLEIDQYAAAINDLLKDLPKAEQMGAAGRQRVESVYSVERRVDLLMGVITEKT